MDDNELIRNSIVYVIKEDGKTVLLTHKAKKQICEAERKVLKMMEYASSKDGINMLSLLLQTFPRADGENIASNEMAKAMGFLDALAEATGIIDISIHDMEDIIRSPPWCVRDAWLADTGCYQSFPSVNNLVYYYNTTSGGSTTVKIVTTEKLTVLMAKGSHGIVKVLGYYKVTDQMNATEERIVQSLQQAVAKNADPAAINILLSMLIVYSGQPIQSPEYDISHGFDPAKVAVSPGISALRTTSAWQFMPEDDTYIPVFVIPTEPGRCRIVTVR